ncbi:hypothetical protein EZS27_017328 [termite gut metagenome]|uniref:H repeat-associated protein N-terminal domain-containing protein n=1 Tax=termite gut metagenome TaxID=433724 RepID=A0A5J4RMK4_9ZZZZ
MTNCQREEYYILIVCSFAKTQTSHDNNKSSPAFQHLPDSRMSRNRKHNLLDILILSILSILCGAESWDAIKFFGTTNQIFLKQFLQRQRYISWDKNHVIFIIS